MNILSLGLISITCFWYQIMQGFTLLTALGIIILFCVGYLLRKLYCKKLGSYDAATMAAAIFMISVNSCGTMPNMYIGILALIFASLGLKYSVLSPFLKFTYIAGFILLHILKYFIPLSLAGFILACIANLLFCFFAASGIKKILTPDEIIGGRILRNAKNFSITILPIFYILLIYAYISNKQFFIFISRFFNILGLALFFLFYLSYLLHKQAKDNQAIYLRLFVAALIEALSTQYYFYVP